MGHHTSAFEDPVGQRVGILQMAHVGLVLESVGFQINVHVFTREVRVSLAELHRPFVVLARLSPQDAFSGGPVVVDQQEEHPAAVQDVWCWADPWWRRVEGLLEGVVEVSKKPFQDKGLL